MKYLEKIISSPLLYGQLVAKMILNMFLFLMNTFYVMSVLLKRLSKKTFYGVNESRD